MTSPPFDALVRSVSDPAATRSYVAAWALDCGDKGAPRVSVLESQLSLPPRHPLPNELFLWFVAPTMSVGWEGFLPFLNQTEREQIARLHQPVDRWSFGAARAGARLLLATVLGCLPSDVAFIRGVNGKPSLDPAHHGDATRRVHFNVSHTRGLAAVALAGCAVGVDVEAVREMEDMHAVADAVFAVESIIALSETAAAARTALFYRFWALGEAFIKATGEGLSLGLKTFAFNTDGVPYLTRVSGAWSPSTRWRFGIFPNDANPR